MASASEAKQSMAWADYAVVWFNGQHDSLIRLNGPEDTKEAARARAAESGELYRTVPLSHIFSMVPGSANKAESPAFIPSLYDMWDAREHAAQRQRGSFVALTGDIDKGDHAPEEVRAAVVAFAADAAHLIYTSAHSRPGDQRWRIVLPLAEPQAFEDWNDAQNAFYDFMEARGIVMDRALARAAQPVYAPNVPAVHDKSGTVLRGDDGKPLHFRRAKTALTAPGLTLDRGAVFAGIAAIRRKRAADDATRERLRAEAAKARENRPKGDGASVIDDFNRENSVAKLLEMYGYERCPRHAEDWKSRYQESGSYATRIMGDKWFSLSGSDAANGLGNPHKDGCWGDGFDLFLHYKHGGDHKAAFRELYAERAPNVIPFRMSEPPEWMNEIPPHDEEPEWPSPDAALEVDLPETVDYEDRWPEPVDLWSRYEEPELPSGLLPGTLEAFARRQAAVMGADAAGMAMAALTVCATAIPDCIEIQVKRNDPSWREHARMWTALVGPPSRKKTPVFKAVMAPLRRLDNDLMRAYLQASEEYEALSKEDRKASSRPQQRRLIISDTTIEAAQEVMMDSPDGILSEQDELSGWFGSMDRYNTKGGGDRAFWLKAFNGGTYNLNRIGRGAKQISNLSISLLGGIQPEPMRKFASESVDDGLLQRMLPVILRPSTVGQDVPLDQTADDYDGLVRDLYGLRNRGGVTLFFSDGARAIRDRLECEHLELSNALESVSPKLAAHYGKYDGIFARLCLIWHCIGNAYRQLPLEISEDTAQRVSAFMAEFIRPSAIAFYAGVLGMSAGHEELIALASIIVAKGMGEVSARDVQRAGQTLRHLTADQFRQIAEKMESFGWVERGEPKPKSNTPRWVVNPRVHALFADRAELEMARRDAARDALRNALGGGEI